MEQRSPSRWKISMRLSPSSKSAESRSTWRKVRRQFVGWRNFAIPMEISSSSTHENRNEIWKLGSQESVSAIRHLQSAILLMSVLVDKNTRLVVQGITGSAGAFHTRQCMDYGTNVVAGVTPGKGGQMFDDKVPVFDTVWEARQKTGCNASMVFVPAPAAADSILEAVDAGIELVVCITEGIPVMDMMRVKAQMHGKKSRLIGPNCPGIITPGACKIGIMPGYIHKPGSVGVISRSGTLTYEAVWQLTSRGYGQSTCIGIGGDPIHGMSHLAAGQLFNEERNTDPMNFFGENGGSAEEETGRRVQTQFQKTGRRVH